MLVVVVGMFFFAGIFVGMILLELFLENFTVGIFYCWNILLLEYFIFGMFYVKTLEVFFFEW